MSNINVFVSYARKDEALLKKLEQHLSLLQRQHFITAWYDHNISAGSNWTSEVDKHLNNAQIILLLISADFIASAYPYSSEMKQALALHESGRARVIPIILRPVDWLGTTPLGKLQALPTGGKPVTTWHPVDDAFLNIAHGIRRVVEEMTTSFPAISPLPDRSSSRSASIDSLIRIEAANGARSLAHNERLAYLELIIRRCYSSIRGFENIIHSSDDPGANEEAQKSIKQQELIVKDFLHEYMEVSNELGTIVPTDIIQISANFSDTSNTDIKGYNDIRSALGTLSLREMRLLGLDLGVDVDMLPGENAESKIVSLLDYMRQRSRIDDLKTYLKRKRPTLEFAS